MKPFIYGFLAALALFTVGVLLAYADDAPTPDSPAVTADTQPVAPPVVPPSSAVLRINKTPDIPHATTCTAFYVGGNAAVTAGHCVGGDIEKETFTLVADNGMKFEAQIYAYGAVDHGADDFAILTFDDSKAGNWTPDKLDCSHKPLPIGTEVQNEGFPGDEESQYRMTFGYIIGAYENRDLISNFHRPVIPFQGLLAPGMSGGPMKDRATGLVIGINAAVDIADNVGNTPGHVYGDFDLATPIDIVCDLLHRN